MTDLPEDLLDGYRRFRGGRLQAEQVRYRTLAETGQRPPIMLIGCCDSRAAPETIFDAGPGQLFVVRNVANLVPPYEPDGGHHSTSAALEFAVQVLRVNHVVVMGHGHCGGIAAVLNPADEPLSPGDFIGKWMALLKPSADRITDNGIMTPGERQIALERISIRHSVANLRTFPCVAELEKRGKLMLHGAWFNISTGELWSMDSKTGEFERVWQDAVTSDKTRSE